MGLLMGGNMFYATSYGEPSPLKEDRAWRSWLELLLFLDDPDREAFREPRLLPDFLESPVPEEFPIPEDLNQHVLPRFALQDRLEVVITNTDELQAATLRVLPGVCDGFLPDLPPGAVHLDRGALEGELEGVPVHLLKEGTAHPKGHVVRGPSEFQDFAENLVEHPVVHAIPLDDPDLRMEHLEPFPVHGVTEALSEDIQDPSHHNRGMSGVRANDQGALHGQDLVPEFPAPDVLAGVIDVVGIADAGYDTVPVLVQHVGERFPLALPSPGGHRAVLRGRDGVPAHGGAVVLHRGHDAGEVIRPLEVREVGRSPDACALYGGGPAEPEIVKLVGEEGGVPAALRGPENQALHLPAEGSHGRRIPGLDQKGLQVVREPPEFRASVLHRHQDIVTGDHHALRNRPDANRELPAVVLQEVVPTLLVHQGAAEMPVEEGLGEVDVVPGHDRSREVALQDVLEAEEDRLPGEPVRSASPGLKVGVDGLGPRRVLRPMSHLVAVSQAEDVRGEGHDFSGAARRMCGGGTERSNFSPRAFSAIVRA